MGSSIFPQLYPPQENVHLWGGRTGLSEAGQSLPIMSGLNTFGLAIPNAASLAWGIGSLEIKSDDSKGRVLVLLPSHSPLPARHSSDLSPRGRRRHSTRRIKKKNNKNPTVLQRDSASSVSGLHTVLVLAMVKWVSIPYVSGDQGAASQVLP